MNVEAYSTVIMQRTRPACPKREALFLVTVIWFLSLTVMPLRQSQRMRLRKAAPTMQQQVSFRS